MVEVIAAKANSAKNIMENIYPPGICKNTLGNVINTKPAPPHLEIFQRQILQEI